MDGRGKRGGGRVVYYWKMNRDTICLLAFYAKNRKENLTQAEIETLIAERDAIIGK